MKVIFHLLNTNNPFGRDRVTETLVDQLVNSLIKTGTHEYNYEIKKIDHYNKSAIEEFKNELLVHDKEIFHVIIPGGQYAQESLELNLVDMSLQNTLVVYNSNWHLLNEPKIQFGKIAETLHYNLGAIAPNPEKDITSFGTAEILDATLILYKGLFHEAYKNYGALTPPPVDDYVNFKEKQSKKVACSRPQGYTIWKHAELNLPGIIIEAIKIYRNEIVKNEEADIKQEIQVKGQVEILEIPTGCFPTGCLLYNPDTPVENPQIPTGCLLYNPDTNSSHQFNSMFKHKAAKNINSKVFISGNVHNITTDIAVLDFTNYQPEEEEMDIDEQMNSQLNSRPTFG